MRREDFIGYLTIHNCSLIGASPDGSRLIYTDSRGRKKCGIHAELNYFEPCFVVWACKTLMIPHPDFMASISDMLDKLDGEANTK